jgi:hypothetical protein
MGIALMTITMGKLNVIAPIVSMFFLISYGLLNYATFYEARASSPSFRPRFRWFDARLSLLGCLACLGVMMAINLAAGLVAVSVLFAIYQYLKRTAGPSRWADSRRSYHLHRLREHILAAAAEPEHPRDWRPQVLAFSADSRRRGQLLRFASWIEGGSGLTTLVQILEGEGLKMVRLQEEAEAEIRKDIAQHDFSAFPLAIFAPTLEGAVLTLVQGFGIGPLKANIVLLNWFEQIPAEGILGLRQITYARNLRSAFRLGCNIVLLDAKEDEWATLETIPPDGRRIDIWWWDDATSRLMLLLAHLMKRSEMWNQATIRVLAASYDKKSGETIRDIGEALEEVRIDAESEVVTNATADSITSYSADAALVFIPFRLAGSQVRGPFGGELKDLLPALPIVAMVLGAEDIDLDAEPEEGKAAEAASALDALNDAQKKAEEAEKEASKRSKEAEEKLKELDQAIASGADEEALAGIKISVKEARERTESVVREAAKARARLEEAQRVAEELGVLTHKEGGDQEKTPETEKKDALPKS